MKNMFNRLPHFVFIKNKKYFINTDFRIFLDFEVEMQGKNKQEAIKKCLFRFYPAFLEILNKGLLKEAVDEFIKFYKCGKKDVEVKQNNKQNKNLRIFDYEFDSDLIWGAYYSQFKVDLTVISLHWWKFKAMWNSLSKDCEFNKIRGYRAYDGKDKELLAIKESYTLPPTEKELDDIKRQQSIYEELNKIASK